MEIYLLTGNIRQRGNASARPQFHFDLFRCDILYYRELRFNRDISYHCTFLFPVLEEEANIVQVGFFFYTIVRGYWSCFLV